MAQRMANAGEAITTDEDYLICSVKRRRGSDTWFGTFSSYGTWDGATVAWKLSFDGGTTLFPITDYTAIAVTQTADGAFNMPLGDGGIFGVAPLLYATISSAGASTSLIVGVCDNTN